MATKTGIAKRKKKTQRMYCDNCDGCGWYEGGKTLQTKCEKCNGAGKVEVPRGKH